MEEAPTKEVVKALLDYLVDPLLASNVSKKDPSLHTQEAVAKQVYIYINCTCIQVVLGGKICREILAFF